MRPAFRLSMLLLAATLPLVSACDKPKPNPEAGKDEGAGAKAEAAGADEDEGAAGEGAGADSLAWAEDGAVAQELEAKRHGDELDHDAAAIKATHDQMAALLVEARKLVEAGDLSGAAAKYEQLLGLDPHYRPALVELAAAEAKAENWAAAVHHAKLAAKLTDNGDASKAVLFDQIGQYAAKEGKANDAAHYFRESLKLADSPEVQARLDALGEVAPELEIPPGPPDSVDSLHLFATVEGSAEDVCAAYPSDDLCVAKSCTFTAAEGDESWGVFEVGDGSIDCYHPAIRTGDARWAVYTAALMDSHGVEVHQGVDRLELEAVEAEGGPYLVIHYAEHLYERIWAEDLAADAPVEEDKIDAEGLIVCQRGEGDKTLCTAPITTSLDFSIGEHGGKFTAKIEFSPDHVVVSDVVKQGKADAAVRAYFDGVLLSPGPHTLPIAH